MAQVAKPSYFWSDQYGRRIQFAGHRTPGCRVEVLEGDPAEADFLAQYVDPSGTPVAVLGVDRPRSFGRMRRRLGRRPAATH